MAKLNKVLSLLLAVFMLSTTLPKAHSATYDYPVQGGNIKFDPTTGTITGCDRTIERADIPSEIYGVKVTAIGYRAFALTTNLKYVSIPSSVTSIESDAFRGTDIKTITIPNSVVEIGTSAFISCPELESVNIAGSVKELPRSLFYSCKKLKEVNLGYGIEKIDSCVFEGCEKLDSIILPDSIESIGGGAFVGCYNLTTVTIGSGIKTISDGVFKSCKNLSAIYFRGDAPAASSKMGDYNAAYIVYYPEGFSGWTTPTWNGYISRSYILDGSSSSFKDVPSDAYFYDAVQWARDKGITIGVSATIFDPKGTCTRSQVATFLWRAKGQPEPRTSINPFEDISPRDWYYKAVLWAYENNITIGTSTTTFSPNNTCTSSQVVTFLWRALGNPASKGPSSIASLYPSGFYTDAVAWADTTGLLAGTSTTFNPSALCPRSDIVTYLYRALA